MLGAPDPIRQARPDEARALAPMFARAFLDDPVASWALPSARRREAQLRRFYTVRLATLLPEELSFCSEDHSGAALWAPPDRWREPPSELLRYRIFTRSLARFLIGGRAIEQAHPREPHYYLFSVAVDPAAQGRGLGGALMRPMLERCDAEGVPAYLESSKERNLPLYERHGFQVTRVLELFRGPPLWLMWREPR